MYFMVFVLIVLLFVQHFVTVLKSAIEITFIIIIIIVIIAGF